MPQTEGETEEDEGGMAFCWRRKGQGSIKKLIKTRQEEKVVQEKEDDGRHGRISDASQLIEGAGGLIGPVAEPNLPPRRMDYCGYRDVLSNSVSDDERNRFAQAFYEWLRRKLYLDDDGEKTEELAVGTFFDVPNLEATGKSLDKLWCRAFGTVLLEDKEANEARSCHVREGFAGASVEDLENILATRKLRPGENQSASGKPFPVAFTTKNLEACAGQYLGPIMFTYGDIVTKLLIAVRVVAPVYLNDDFYATNAKNPRYSVAPEWDLVGLAVRIVNPKADKEMKMNRMTSRSQYKGDRFHWGWDPAEEERKVDITIDSDEPPAEDSSGEAIVFHKAR